MKFVFFGSPGFAAIILEKLIGAGFIPEAVVCNPDRPFGRKKTITPPPAKSLILKHKTHSIPILQPIELNDEFLLQISSFKPDVFIVAAYSKIIPQKILDIPKLGTIGVHPSLLPKYRGASPIQSAILNGEEKTGTTLYLMDAKMDNGPILAQQELNYELRIMNYELLAKKLADLSAELLIETLPDIEEKIKNAKAQDEGQATYTKKFSTEDGFVDLEKDSPTEIDRKVRALNPDPGIFTLSPSKGGHLKRMKILEAELDANGKLVLKKIQFEGKNPQTLI